MSLRLSLFVVLAVAGCAKQAPQARAPKPMFDLSRICADPQYGSVCADKQAPAALPESAPIRVDTNLATPPSTVFGLQS
jgi:hypothetical protein